MRTKTASQTEGRCPAGRALQLVALALLGSLFVLLGCVEANPLPSPGQPGGGRDGGGAIAGGNDAPSPRAEAIAYIQRGLTFVSALGPEETEGSVVLVGAPEAASEPGEIEVAFAGESFRVATDDLLGFAAVLDSVSADMSVVLSLIVTDEESGEEKSVASLAVTVKALDGDRNESAVPWAWGTEADGEYAGEPSGGSPPDDLDPGADLSNDGGFAPVTVSAPDELGEVHVRSGVVGVTPFSLVFVFHNATGRSYSAQAHNDGSVDIALPAEVGDELRVFAANPVVPDATSQTFELVVPASDPDAGS